MLVYNARARGAGEAAGRASHKLARLKPGNQRMIDIPVFTEAAKSCNVPVSLRCGKPVHRFDCVECWA